MKIACAIVLAPAIAFAQPVVAPEPPTQSMLPNLLATSLGTTVEVRVDYIDFDEVENSMVNAYARVQHVTPQGFGGYVALPFAFIEGGSEDGLFEGAVGTGNVELGALFVASTSPRTDVLFRAGAAIDTTTEDDDLAVSVTTILPRLLDTYASGMQTTWGRAQAQVRHKSNTLRLGASIGFDAPVAGAAADQDGMTGVINGVLSAGIQQNKLGLGISFVMAQPLTDEDDENLT